MKRLITIIIGIACVIIGIVIMISYFNAQKTQTAETNATIVRIDSEVETDTDGFETRYYTPVVKYSVNGTEYEKQLPNSRTTNSSEYKEGQEFTIQYNPDKPEEISQKGDKGGLIGGIFFIIVGIIIAIASLFGRM